ncbi:MAG: PAS domain S-box protein, partial [Deltaproteobacteria bacterium]|nr:PAS domain S-box protein [Deltaproteobacteria bacterium]
PLVIFELESTGKLSMWGKYTEKMLGYSEQELRDDLIPQDIHEKPQEAFEAARVAIKEGIFERELNFRRKDGSLFPVHFICVPREDEEQNVVGMYALALDISERRRVEARSRQQQQQLIQAAKMASLGTLVSGVAHEINNPVNLILYNIPLFNKVWQDVQPLVDEAGRQDPQRSFGGLSGDFLKDNFAQLISDMGMAADRIVKIIDGLKRFSRQTGAEEQKEIAVNDVVRNAVTLAQTTVRKAGIELVLDLCDVLPSIRANPQHIEQVVLNLIINAAQAIDHAAGCITITSGRDESTGGVRVAVSDNGRGVNPDIADSIFDPFQTDKQAEGGTGLGLSISYNIVKEHGGEISFISDPGCGALFSVVLPQQQQSIRRKVLIADDDQAIHLLIKRALVELGDYEIESVYNGIEACIKLGTFQPELLI